ncbi:hypothetical protein A7P95_03120 [Eikenella longinqua]|uniref:Uncharacterized protein n=1 Tax=Eikenella longinqua TaxID=1795827 RepID=A0A1A9RYH8_9NEIS|nr:hypothetical protein A7P95_03120 [Eikenella longinqua]
MMVEALAADVYFKPQNCKLNTTTKFQNDSHSSPRHCRRDKPRPKRSAIGSTNSAAIPRRNSSIKGGSIIVYTYFAAINELLHKSSAMIW